MTPLLEIRGLTVEFDGFRALDGIDLQVAPSGVHALIGPNGAGKTTLLDAVCGRTRPTAGRILLDGRWDVGALAEHRRVQLGIGRKFQTPSIFPALTVAENLELAAAPPSLLRSLFGPLPRSAEERIRRVLDQTGLADLAGRTAGTLSHGQKQWLEIGLLLVRQPKLLLLDEPVAGMSARERHQTAALVRLLGQRSSVLLVEHDMDFVRQVAQTVTVLHEGRVLCEGSMEEISADPRVVASYLGRGTSRHAAG